MRAFPIEGEQLKGVRATRGVEVRYRLIQRRGIETELFRQLGNGISLLGLFVGSVEDPARAEAFHDRAVGHEEGGLVVVAPGFEGDHFKGLEEPVFAFVVEAGAFFVHDLEMLARMGMLGGCTDDAIVVSPDHGIRLIGSRVDKLAVHAVEGARCACADF
jgi:hypothetical protein